MTEEELYEVNGGFSCGRKEKADKPQKETTQKESRTKFHFGAHCGTTGIDAEVDYDHDVKTSTEKVYEEPKNDSIELERIDNAYIEKYGVYVG